MFPSATTDVSLLISSQNAPECLGGLNLGTLSLSTTWGCVSSIMFFLQVRYRGKAFNYEHCPKLQEWRSNTRFHPAQKCMCSEPPSEVMTKCTSSVLMYLHVHLVNSCSLVFTLMME